MAKILETCLLVAMLSIVHGCGTLPSGRTWGGDVSLTNWDRIKSAAVTSLKDPETWVPALGAAIFAIDDFDAEVSDWASRKTPIYGSRGSASDASDDIKEALGWVTIGTTLLTPSGDQPMEWTINKLRGTAVVFAGIGIADGSTNALKREIDRLRPDQSDDRSFPSGHATQAYARSTMAARNIDALALNENTRFALRLGIKTMAAATAWARVEAKKHYPSDVLAGAALAHFISSFVHDGFLGSGEEQRLMVLRDGDRTLLQFQWAF